jgi:hypothetical protein
MPADGIAPCLYDLARAVNSVGAPSLHGRAIYVLALMLQPSSAIELNWRSASRAYVESHPADGLIVWDFRLFDELQLQRLGVEGDCDDDARLHPRAAHKMMLRHVGCRSMESRNVSRPQMSCPNGSCERQHRPCPNFRRPRASRRTTPNIRDLGPVAGHWAGCLAGRKPAKTSSDMTTR